jgi:N6-adenosine-specific RNA methylase IME4
MSESLSRQSSGAQKRYRTIVADPPWDLKAGPEFGSNGPTRDLIYPTMTVDEIAALPVREMSDHCDTDAHLYLWTVNAYLRESFDIARAWGFHPTQTIVWCKSVIGTGLGGTWPANVEFVLFCRRPKLTHRPDVYRVTSALADIADAKGISQKAVNEHMGYAAMAMWWLSRDEYRCACPTDEQWPKLRDFLGAGHEFDAEVARINAAKGTAARAKLQRAPSSWFDWPRSAHSAKPEAFLDHVEQVSPGPYLELFARRDRLGWDTWGNESLGTAEMAA